MPLRIDCPVPGCTNRMDRRSRTCRTCWAKAKRDASESNRPAKRRCEFCEAEFRPSAEQIRNKTGDFCSALCRNAYSCNLGTKGTFGGDLRRARLRVKVTSTRIAEAIGCTKQHVCQVERGVTAASEKFQEAVRKGFPELDL